MNLKTFTKHYRTLSKQLDNNPHRLEILNIMQQQLIDDNSVIERQIVVKV